MSILKSMKLVGAFAIFNLISSNSISAPPPPPAAPPPPTAPLKNSKGKDTEKNKDKSKNKDKKKDEASDAKSLPQNPVPNSDQDKPQDKPQDEEQNKNPNSSASKNKADAPNQPASPPSAPPTSGNESTATNIKADGEPEDKTNQATQSPQSASDLKPKTTNNPNSPPLREAPPPQESNSGPIPQAPPAAANSPQEEALEQSLNASAPPSEDQPPLKENEAESSDEIASEPQAEQEQPLFIKGHLAHVGTRQMLSRFDHIGVNSGIHIIGNDVFIGVDPGLAFYWDTFAFALHAPLRLQAFGMRGTEFEVGTFKPRLEDWDDLSEWTRFIRFVTVGRKEEQVYFTINTMRPSSIGHAMLMDKYQANIDIDRFMTGMSFDAYNDYAGFQAQLNDITLANQIIGGLVFIKPLSFVSNNTIAKSLSLGLEYVTDLQAPLCIQDDNGDCVRGSGQMGGIGPFAEGDSASIGAAPENQGLIHLDEDTGLPNTKTGAISALGFSGEIKLIKTRRHADIKAYATHHQFLNERGGSGSAGGLLARLNFGETWINALRLRGEYRTFEDGFIPGYFDSVYEVSKYGYFPKAYQHQVTPTKYQAIFGDPKNEFAPENFGRRHGYKLEAEWGLFKKSRRNKQFAMSIGISDSNGPDDSNAHLHIDFPALGVVQIFSSIMRFGLKDISDIPNMSLSSIDNNTIILSGLRLQILPFLFLNTHFAYNFRRAAGPSSEYNIATGNMPYYEGRHPKLQPTNFFENVPTLFVELEIGWEVDDDDEDEDEDEEKEDK